MRPSTPAGISGFLLLSALGAASLYAAPARAFPTMIRHGYPACAQCHVDPSGAGVLTDYGRAQAEVLVRQTWGKPVEDDPGKKADFAFGAVPLPDWLELQGDVRALAIPEPGNFRGILMQADLRGAVDAGPFLAYASLGPVSAGAEAARVTSNDAGWNLVSREHWVGVQPAKKWVFRAGRMDLPFGIRTENHILYTRSATRTDINADQQVGVAAAYGTKKVRAEVMGIAGNFQVAPDAFRERGYSATFAYAPVKTAEVGVSSLVTHAGLDIQTLMERTRQAHGVFARVAPIEPVVVMAEADFLSSHDVDAAGTATDSWGLAGAAEVDWEPIQGVHGKAIVEHCDTDYSDTAAGVTTFGGAGQWFFAPRTDLRLDALYGTVYCTPGVEPTFLGLAQLHFLL